MTLSTPSVGTLADIDEAATPSAAPTRSSAWAVAGLGAGIAGVMCIVGSSMAGAVYDPAIAGNATAITAKLAEQTGAILTMHTGAMVSAVLILVFAAGLRRRLKDRTPEGALHPQVAAYSLVLLSTALLMGSGLTTEFAFGVQDPKLLVPETAAFFGHWIGTIPWLWVGAGVAALAVGTAGRRYGAVAPWLAWTSLVLGGLITLLGVSPLQYMAGMVGPLWVIIASIGLLRSR